MASGLFSPIFQTSTMLMRNRCLNSSNSSGIYRAGRQPFCPLLAAVVEYALELTSIELDCLRQLGPVIAHAALNLSQFVDQRASGGCRLRRCAPQSLIPERSGLACLAEFIYGLARTAAGGCPLRPHDATL